MAVIIVVGGRPGVEKLMESQARRKMPNYESTSECAEIDGIITSNHNCQVYQNFQDCPNLQNYKI